ncbi:TRAP transporter large permease [Ruegeria sp. PrR005]|uniref:TRAP transporter large permease protein n=1 Tax=Ruegeria sp. PrR005 TaxID=2706882 RepID=A0A6B2NQ29_9RHOB|nr:TRAP transporter large permease [Ruegeria sp. PrR005]NDW45478.1 TRAP transporter large permease [Ruegeria sp. PrR005]
METLGLFALFPILLVLRQSVILILLAATAYVHLVWGDGYIVYLIEDIWTAMDNSVLLAIPMFIIAGALMSRGSIAERLIEIVSAATQWMPGGLGFATILSCALFAAISGSSPATLLAVGAVMYPALKTAGYTRSFALGAVTSAGTLGIIIPPSIPLIIYGIITETSIVDLFLAGIIPGVLLTLALGLYSVIRNRHVPRTAFSLPRLVAALRNGIWSLLLPVILLGGIYSGYFSPTEAAAVSVGYALLIEIFIHRELGIRDFFAVGLQTAQMLGTLFPIVAVALSIKTILAIEGIPQDFASWLQGAVSSKIAFLLAVNAALLIIGCLIDVVSAILLLGPILFAAAHSFGINPVHFGIIMVINLEIGLLTPPVGLNLLVAMTAFRERFRDICVSVLPFIAIMIGILLLVTFIPQLSLLFVTP